MRKSISFQIKFVLFFLTFLFFLNTLISGITNSQVHLSATLFSNSFLILEKEQLRLAKDLGRIDLSVQAIFLGDERAKEEVSATQKLVEQAVASVKAIAGLTDEFSSKVKDGALLDAYLPYQVSIETYLSQVALGAGCPRERCRSARKL